MSTATHLSAAAGMQLAAAIESSKSLQVSATDGSITLHKPAFLQAVSTVLPPDQAESFSAQMENYAQSGAAVLPHPDGGAPALVPYAAMAQIAQAGPLPAAWLAAGLGITRQMSVAEVEGSLRARFPIAPPAMMNAGVLQSLASGTAHLTPSFNPMARSVTSDAIDQAIKLAGALGRASFGPWEGHVWGWAVGFQLTFNHDDAETISTMLSVQGSSKLLEDALAAGLKAGVSGAVTALTGVLSAAGASVLTLIAFGLAENMSLVNNKWGVSLECNWPYTGGFFFWAQGADGAPSVVLTSPDANSTVSGTLNLRANSTSVSGVGFSVNYTAPGAAAAWHPLGHGFQASPTDGSTWNMGIDTRFIPNQTVNLCAMALNDDGTPAAEDTRDYRTVTINNPSTRGFQPMLVRAELITHTNDDDRHRDSGISVTVTAADGHTTLAGLGTSLDPSTGKSGYSENSDHTLALNLSGVHPEAACQNFAVTITQHPRGSDIWKFNATVALYFSDGSRLTKSKGGIQLKDNGASVSF